MQRRLFVHMGTTLVGELLQDDDGRLGFAYGEDWLQSDDSFEISCSLPLRSESFSQKECRGFFGGVLPEQSNRKLISRILQISEQNDFAMLEQIGGECAGALTFTSELLEPADLTVSYRSLADNELLEILDILPKRPLLAGEKGVRLSLAGAQDKLAVCVDEAGNLSLPLAGAPSSHILKPALATWDGIVSNETYCMNLAKQVGLSAAATSSHMVGNVEYLLSKRFDRITTQGEIQRLHQEDFCQALAVPAEIKYQSEGGPDLKACFDLVRTRSSHVVADLSELLNAVIFNWLVGNNDAHGKNFSFLYNTNGERRFAPLYDVVCTQYYPELTNTMAMKIGKEGRADFIGPAEIEIFAKETGLAVAATKRRFVEMAKIVLDGLDGLDSNDETSKAIKLLISERCSRALNRLS